MGIGLNATPMAISTTGFPMISRRILLVAIVILLNGIVSVGVTKYATSPSEARAKAHLISSRTPSEAVSQSAEDDSEEWRSKGPSDPTAIRSRRNSLFGILTNDWYITIDHWAPFAPSSFTISTLSNLYAGIKTIASEQLAHTAPQKLLSFSYGSINLIFYGMGIDVILEHIEAFAQAMERALRYPGVAALFFLSFHIGKGVVIFAILVLATTAMRFQLAHGGPWELWTNWIRYNLIG